MVNGLEDLVAWLFKAVVSGLLGLFWWKSKRDTEKLDKHEKDIVELQHSCVTQNHVREIVREELAPTVKIMEELKQLVKQNNSQMTELSIKIAMEEGYRRAQRDQEGR